MQKILLSTDIGSDIDDALSLLVMLRHPDINLKSIYTVNGDTDSRSFIAKHMVKLAQKKVQVCRGSVNPLGAVVKPFQRGERYSVDWSYIDDKRTEEESSRDLIFVPLKRAGIMEQSIENLATSLAESKHTLFSIGPLTDIALLARHHPETLQNIERLYIMGCRLPSGDSFEHNIRYDSTAAQEVLSLDVPITIIPADLCSHYRMPISQREDMGTSPVGQYVRDMLDAFTGAIVAQEFHRKMIGQISLTRLLQEKIKMRAEVTTISGEEAWYVEKQKEVIIANLDVEAAYCSPSSFWKDYAHLINILQNPRYDYQLGEIMARELQELIPKEISIPDVYVPYCYVHPDKIKIEKMTLDCDSLGNTYVRPGQKHDVVRDLDWHHFQKFVQEWTK